MKEQKQGLRPNELRMGNVVLRPDLGNGKRRMETIVELGKKALTTGPIKVLVDYSDLEGVEITEDVLLKVGFGKTIGFFKTISPNISIELSENNDKSFPQWYCYVRNLNSTSRLDDDFALIRKDLKYLHTLQNIHFDFCDEELDVTKLMEG